MTVAQYFVVGTFLAGYILGRLDGAGNRDSTSNVIIALVLGAAWPATAAGFIWAAIKR